ncbi:hypothetical protein O0L34_g17537 [Tuta absoluta]|nr:hypothetical protein O0L34_g17537 [Tuta absoluta]
MIKVKPEKDLYRLSKTLTWLLRHSAKKEGLHISPEGYVPVDEILRHSRIAQLKYKQEDIEKVVAEDKKQRFVLKKTEGRLFIKACQGHSVPLLKAEHTPITEPIYDIVVHGTYLHAWPSILKQGLSRCNRQHIHFAKGTPKDKSVISGLRGNVEVYIYVDLKKALEDGLKFFESENGVILTEGKDGFLDPKYFLKVIKVDSGFPPYTQSVDLGRTFSRFGNVRVEKLNARMSFAVLAYTTDHEAREAIQASGKVNIYGEFLRVRAWTVNMQPPKREFPRTKQKGMIVEPTEIDLSGDFHQQVDSVLAAVRLTQEEVMNVSVLYADLERALQALWPGCVAMPFGSITTGLGIKTSDADCFVHVPTVYQSQKHNFVNKAKRVLQNYPQIFAEIFAIPRANTPIVKFFHIPTEINCDLSFKTPLGAQNSKLIAFLLHADPRLLPMAVTVKYWAKVHGLSGTGRLTNYALTMMIIFYLQQPPMTILPSVEWLQRDPKDEVIVDSWNTGFMSKKELLPVCANTSSISELLGGFFEYYSNFDFADLVVCPFMGVPVKKECFVDIAKIPPEFDRYKANTLTRLTPPLRAATAMCVQDPFEQCHNVASAISSKLAADIRAFFQFAAKTYENDKLSGCEKFLKTILLDKPKKIRAKSHPEYKINLIQRMIGNITRTDWKDVIREAVLTVFETMLKIKLGEPEPVPDAKKPKERYYATITKTIWKRKQFARLYDFMKKGFVEKQSAITDEVLALDKEHFRLQFTVTLTFHESPKNAGKLAIKLTEGDVDRFKEFGKFFISTVLSWLAQLIKDENKTPNTPEQNQTVVNENNVKNEDLDSDDDDDDDAGENDTEEQENDLSVNENDASSTDEAESAIRNDSESDKGVAAATTVVKESTNKIPENKTTTDLSPEQKAPDKISHLEVALNSITLTDSTIAQNTPENTATVQKASDNTPVDSPIPKAPQNATPVESPVQKAPQNTAPAESPAEKAPETATLAESPTQKTSDNTMVVESPEEKAPEITTSVVSSVQKAPESSMTVESSKQKAPENMAPLQIKQTSSFCDPVQSDTQTNS